MEFFDNHKTLFRTALGLFVGLTIIVAIMPAINNQENNAPLPNYEPLSQEAYLGKKIFIDNGCVACHTQQVRNVDMDKVWGSRPGMPADYAGIDRTDFWRNTATLMGTERTGPDLTNIGTRQPSLAWNLLHLYQPRAVVEKSIMPAYSWLFEIKTELGEKDVEVVVPDAYRKGISGRIVATQEALNLVAYLQSLKQTPLPDGKTPMEFLYKKKEIPVANGNTSSLPDGKLLYTNNCMSCHQANGEGLKGAFPPLKGSPIVLGDDLELFVNIIMLGYDARPEYAVMNAVGTDNNLTPEEVTAIINHEKTSWGNNAKTVTPEEVKKIMDFIKLTSKK
ncbi:MAG: cytochrome-c oxidase [Sphingobacteriia bacterium 24-36-13]|jgi:cytochrome c oxidase cbb3-type subunit 2|uniref:cbb3-type cytochrome c oxidase subunit II n=1 Tax=Sediminibacterium sp. TaxID=1917865 RepID=UPI000BD20FFE|nr:cbb3-type cytochrome c oxidase subunit II [Sediminibacterium sp.]OYZ52094.1 MAG: cytochrome-c oxidase [Sphingobacteriia bacterium 24-36-13]OZA63255.1 MAG: cytochrome-c oxidase [Sphingobacteriia bacterium 39-36-14]HQS25310.1 cbb3-type cytochrome c oxidase subunit II [Sediminibacterium sp.]HQS35781.1 cbb3-type cytochrome c oxidase subunit II [Sediminibacterium sp.]